MTILNESEVRFRDLFENSPDAILVEDLDGNVLKVNRQACQLHRMTREQLVGANVMDLVAPDQRPSVARKFSALLSGKENAVEGFSITSAGDRIPVEIRSTQIRYGGQPAILLHIRDVSARKADEQKLRESEERYRAIFKSAYDGLVVFRKDGTFVDANETWCRMHGIARSDLQAISPQQFIHADSLSQFADFVQTVNEGREFHCEGKGIRGGSTIFDIELYGSPFMFRGEPHLLGVVRDITERKRIEAEREARFWHLQFMEQVNDVVANATDVEPMLRKLLDVLLHQTGCDQAWISTFYVSAAEPVRILAARTRPEFATGVTVDQPIPIDMKSLESLRRGSQPGELLEIGERNIGRYMDAEIASRLGVRSVTIQFLQAKQGDPVILGLHQCSHEGQWTDLQRWVLKDMARRVGDALTAMLARRDLAKSEERFQTLLASLDDVVWSANLDGEILYLNCAVERIYGIPAREFVNHRDRWIETVLPSDRPRAEQSRVELMENGYAKTEYRIRRPDGSVRWLLDTKYLIRGKDGQITGIGGIGSDVTDRKRAEQQLRRRDAELAHMSRVSSMGEMAAALAHELNQPLGTIANFAGTSAHVLRSGKWSEADLLRAIDRINEQALHAGQIIRRLKRYVSQTAPKLDRLDVNAVVMDVVDLMNSIARQQQVKLATQLGHDLPSVLGDKTQIQQVLVNLMSNAIEAMERTDLESREVVIRTEMTDDYVLTSVSDRGCSFATEEISGIFEPYVTTKNGGLGMGLAITRRIVNAHRGDVSAMRNPDGGVTFYFTLPFKVADHEIP